jgi:hypothetical protein
MLNISTKQRRNGMHKALNGKGYVRNGEGVFVTAAGEVYAYHEGELTPLTVTDHPKAYAESEGGRTSAI